jgi:type I restriction enzyme S subunit
MNSDLANKRGYKLTTIGWIPEDWEVKRFGDIFEFKNGINAGKESYGKGIKFINVMEVIYNDFISPEMITGSIQITDKQKELYYVKNGDVLFNRTSETTNEIGLSATYYGKEAVVFGGFVIRGRPINKSIDDKFKRYCFHSKMIREQIIKGGQGAVRTNIGQVDLGKIKFPLPPLSEQKKIAQILSAWDSAIEKTEKLIEKKELLKKGLMQQLLTGKKRLKGFNGEWKEVKLGDIIEEIADGGTPSTSNPNFWNGDINWIVIEDIVDVIKVTKTKITKEGLSKCSSRLWPPGTIILSTGATIGEIGITSITTATKQGICGITVNPNKVMNVYLKHWLESNKGLLLKFAQGSSIKEVRPPTIVKMKMILPQIEEQKEIINCLQALQKNISSLKFNLELLRKQKKSLMQVLLTGRVRVKK